MKNQNESLLDQHKCLEQMIYSNKETLNKIEDDLELIKNNKDTKSSMPSLSSDVKSKSEKRCPYFNSGYCKLKLMCPFRHPENICTNKDCIEKSCKKRHPKSCKYWKKDSCKFGETCEFVHEAQTKISPQDDLEDGRF